MCRLCVFLADDAGAVTVDWVALTAGIIVAGIMVVYAVYAGEGMASVLSTIEDTLTLPM